jgi:serine/threonine protein kinase
MLPGSLKSAEGPKSPIIDLAPPLAFRRILRILLRSPWDNYNNVRQLNQVVFTKHKALFFRVVDIREFNCDDILQQFQLLSKIHHPNVASIYNIYYNNRQLFLVTEYLEVSMS